ncbi:hypothetical protein [Streptomyces lydicus]|uniref:hypothetical protein n=1 Tax=Streptomyces lydicus TaxID=47763 RepID=UPI0037B1D957
MAIAIPSPAPIANDLCTLKEIAAFLSESGHSVSETTVRRYIERYGVCTYRRKGRVVASMSALLRAQRDELDRQAAD